MKYILAMLLAVSTLAHADIAYQPINPERVERLETVLLTLKSVDNIRKACDAENMRRIGKPFGYDLQGCSFRDAIMVNGEPTMTCLILVPKVTNMYIYGHELRHCYEGHWHK